MKKRVLTESGKFKDFTGTRVLKSIKSPAMKELERKNAEQLAGTAGVTVENPVMGGLHPEDMIMVNSGEMTLPALIALAKLRNIPLNASLKGKDAVVKHILDFQDKIEGKEVVKSPALKPVQPVSASNGNEGKEPSAPVGESTPSGDGSGLENEDREKLLAGIPMAEMKVMAQKYGVTIPKGTKVAEAKEMLLNHYSSNSEEDDL